MTRPADLQPLVTAWMANALAEGGAEGDLRVGGGAWVGRCDQAPQAGCLHLEGSILRSTAAAVCACSSTPQTLASGVLTTVVFSGVRFDPLGMWESEAPGRLTCKVRGVYLLAACGAFQAASTGNRLLKAVRNGQQEIACASGLPSSAYPLVLNLCACCWLEEGDWVVLAAYQNSGSARSLLAVDEYSPALALCRLA